MARARTYERIVDAVLTDTSAGLMCDTEIQNGVKIKEEAVDAILNTDMTKDNMLVKNYINPIGHELLSKDNALSNNLNNKENERVFSSHSAHLDGVDKIVNLKRKNVQTEKEHVHDTLSQPKKKQKYSNEISMNKNSSTFSTALTENFKRKGQNIRLDSKMRIQHTTVSENKKSKCTCNICFRIFISVPSLKQHIRYYDHPGDYKCSICEKCLTTREELESHIKTFHRTYVVNKYIIYSCMFCSCTFKAKYILQSHLYHRHSELIYSGNIIKHDNPKSENSVNTSVEEDTLKIDAHKEFSCSIDLVKSDANITLINNAKFYEDNATTAENSRTEKLFDHEMSSTKKLRQPTLVEYLELCKKKRDINTSLNKLNIMNGDLLTFPLCHDGQMKKDLEPKLLEQYNGQVDHLSIKPYNLREQIAHSPLKESEKQEICASKKPFVRLHADVEMMKSFLDNLSDTIKDEPIQDHTSEIVSYDHKMPYSLRSARVIPFVEASSNLGRKNRNVSNKIQLNAICNTRIEQNMIDSNKADTDFWKTIMIKFKCKNCKIALTRCDEESRNCQQTSTMEITVEDNTSLIVECNSMPSEESDIRKKLVLKELEVSLERVATVPTIYMKEDTIPDEEHKDKRFLCKVCKKDFSSKLAKRSHIKSSHIAYMSSICDARYTLKHKLLEHYLCEHLFEQNQCCVCYVVLPDHIALKRHLNVHCLKYIQKEDDKYSVDINIECNSTNKVRKCLHCNKTFSKQSSLVAHQSHCIVWRKIKKNQENTMQITNQFPKIILKIQHNKNSDENTVSDGKINYDDLYENSNNNSVENLNNHQTLLVNEQEVEENNQNPSVCSNFSVTDKIMAVDKPEDPKKLSEIDNSIISNQDVVSAKLDVIKSQSKIYPCNICQKKFHNHKNLQKHIRTFSGTTNVCPICDTAFSSKRLLQTHIAAAHVQQISKTYNFHCMFCNQGFFKKHELRPHILHLHRQQMINTLTRSSHASQQESNELVTHTAMCNICNLVFETYDRYVQHKMYYYKNHTFICSICAQNFKGMYMFHHHNKLTHYSEDKRKSYRYTCDICNEGFNHESHFYSHNMHVHPNEEILAEIAKESEENKYSYAVEAQEQIRNFFLNQQKDIEQLSNDYTCQICQLMCKDADDMIKHTAFYSNDGDFRCDRCKRQFRTLDLLEQHTKLNHTNDVYNGQLCHICGEILETVTSLKCHEKHFHPNDVMYNDNCENGGQALSSNIVCKKNQYTHDVLRSEYNCLFCDMKFSTANAIKTHIIQTHIDLPMKQSVLTHTPSTIDGNNISKQSVQQLVQTNQASSSKDNSTESDLPMKQSALKHTFSTIDADTIPKQSVQQLVQTNQASSPKNNSAKSDIPMKQSALKHTPSTIDGDNISKQSVQQLVQTNQASSSKNSTESDLPMKQSALKYTPSTIDANNVPKQSVQQLVQTNQVSSPKKNSTESDLPMKQSALKHTPSTIDGNNIPKQSVQQLIQTNQVSSPKKNSTESDLPMKQSALKHTPSTIDGNNIPKQSIQQLVQTNQVSSSKNNSTESDLPMKQSALKHSPSTIDGDNISKQSVQQLVQTNQVSSSKKNSTESDLPMKQSVLKHTPFTIDGDNISKQSVQQLVQTNQVSSPKKNSTESDLPMKQSVLKHTSSIIDGDNISKQSVQQLVQTNQASSSKNNSTESDLPMKQSGLKHTPSTIDGDNISKQSVQQLIQTNQASSSKKNSTESDLPMKQSGLKHTPSTIDGDNISKQSVQQLVQTNQASSSDLPMKQSALKHTSSTIDGDNISMHFVQQLVQTNQVLSSKDNSTKSVQRSDNILYNTVTEKGIKDKTTIESSTNGRMILPKKKEVTRQISIPMIQLNNPSAVNISRPIAVPCNIISSNGSSIVTSVPPSIGSVNSFQRNYILSSQPALMNKPNLISSSNDQSTNKSKITIYPPTGPLKALIVRSQPGKNNGITDQTSEAVSHYDRNHNYICPFCPLEYPSLPFFHAHLKYFHAHLIRTDIMRSQLNQSIQGMIECLLCSCIFTDENKYKKHLKNSHAHYVYIPNHEEVVKANNTSNPLKAQTNDNESSKTPEIITVDDDDNDNVENSDQCADKAAATSTITDPKRQDEKIGKLRVKPFAKIIENLCADRLNKLQRSKRILSYKRPN